MDNFRILRVQIVERIAKLISPEEHFSLRKGALTCGQHCKKVFARNVLHHEKLTIAFVEMIADARQRLMMQTRQQTRLALELFAQPLFGKKCFFQRDSRIEPLVDRFVHRTHSALSKLTNNAVAFL